MCWYILGMCTLLSPYLHLVGYFEMYCTALLVLGFLGETLKHYGNHVAGCKRWVSTLYLESVHQSDEEGKRDCL